MVGIGQILRQFGFRRERRFAGVLVDPAALFHVFEVDVRLGEGEFEVEQVIILGVCFFSPVGVLLQSFGQLWIPDHDIVKFEALPW